MDNVIGVLSKKRRYASSSFSYWWEMYSDSLDDEDDLCHAEYDFVQQFDDLTLEQARNVLKEVVSHNSTPRMSESELLEKIGRICS